MMETLEIIGRLTTRLGSLTCEQLCQVCQHLEMEVGDAASQTNGRLRLARKVVSHLNSDDVQDQEDGGLEYLQRLEKFISGLTASDPSHVAPDVPEPKSSKMESTDAAATAPEDKPLINTGVMSWIRREFKISGQIGEPGQKDRLTFASLASQIETGREKGYSDRDIVHGVIRAIVPGSELRSYLEGRAKISLPSLRRIIRSHYQEREATELFKQLSQLAQAAKESPQAFLLRAFNMRQKVLFASQEVESKLRYEPQLVREMFRHTLLTGLRSEAIKTELRPYLDDPATTDEVLFEKMNVCASLETERQRKLNVGRSSSIMEVSTDTAPKEQPAPKQGLLMTEIAALRAGIAELAPLKSQVAALQQQLQRPQGSPPWPTQQRVRRSCRKCTRDGRETCDHCFHCGSSEHFARGCRQRRPAQQGNDRGLLPGDRE